MGKPTGFVEYDRVDVIFRPVEERLGDYRQVALTPTVEDAQVQAARCMDCGIPFCHSGCPLGNLIPDWNELAHQGRWAEAYERLRETNNFPEFTGQICPAPCESACVAGIGGEAVSIEQVEWAIAEEAYRGGFVESRPPVKRTGKHVAVIGSGPAGLACADQLNQAGHQVVVFERAPRPGGLLRYGIPDFKLEKWVIDRRLDVMEGEGIRFVSGVEVGTDVGRDELDMYDAVVLCTGSTVPRDLPIAGRDLPGVHFAMEFLGAQNRGVAGLPDKDAPTAAGKHVVVIGGGDTGSDCVGTANRQGAASVTQFEVLPTPSLGRPDHQPWPYMPMVLKTTSSHKEGAQREWSVLTTTFGGEGHVESVTTVRAERTESGFQPVEGTEEVWPAELVLLAVGYTGTENGLVSKLGLERGPRGTVGGEAYATNRPGYFAAGDARRGQSLVVWAISEGREAAKVVDMYLQGQSQLPTKGEGDLPRR